MEDIILNLYNIILERKDEKQQGSYTAYLFGEGMDKILKKCGEEMTEVIIGAKNNDKEQTAEEICDVIYHMLVMMAQLGVEPKDVKDILVARSEKMCNLKEKHKSDPLS
ncbi:MAG: phosphoribosyl-ATP diphosphatase [Oscillospiraceae bacterium]